MILEAIQYTATALVTPRAFRPFIRSSLGLWGRAGRCAKDWAVHEENCHAFIRETIAPMKQRRTAVVLGSGLLRDVPIVELSKSFDTVVLVDLVHLASVRAWITVKRLTNIRLISRDLSGLPDALSGKTPEPLAFLRQVPYLDLVISANIVSQIGVGCGRVLERSAHDNPDVIISQLICAHLDGLAQLPCRTALLTDVSYEVTDRNGAILEEDDLLCGVAAPEPKHRWDWPVAPFGEIGRDRQAIHRVIAV
jgi:hypothetical protein